MSSVKDAKDAVLNTLSSAATAAGNAAASVPGGAAALGAAQAVPGAVGAVLARATQAISTSPAYPHLSAPLVLGELTLRNRNLMASLTRNRSVPTTVPNAANIEYYKQRAEGGCGLILSEGTLVSQQGTEWPHAPGIWSDEQVAGWQTVTESVHRADGLIFCQLWHVGRVAHPDMSEQKHANKPVPAPSAISAQGGKFRDLPGQPGYVTPTALEDPRTIVAEFRHAAENAKKAGFDGVELHSANGYLIHQFLDTGSNTRTDEFGGSIENRCRLGLEILRELIDVWGPGRVGIKLNPCAGYNDTGMPLPETIPTFVHYITEICALGIAYVQLVRYVPVMDLQMEDKPDSKFKRGIPHDVLAVYGPLVKTPPEALENHDEKRIRGAALPARSANPAPTRLFLNGALLPREADALIGEGKIDGAVFGQLWIGNPDLQARLAAGLDVGGRGVNDAPDVKTFYAPPEGAGPEKGYADYPKATLARPDDKARL